MRFGSGRAMDHRAVRIPHVATSARPRLRPDRWPFHGWRSGADGVDIRRQFCRRGLVHQPALGDGGQRR